MKFRDLFDTTVKSVDCITCPDPKSCRSCQKACSPEKLSKMNDKDMAALADVWERINLRQSYGVRSEMSDKPCTRIFWSNGSASWFVSGGRCRIEPGAEVRMDADEILVPHSPARMERIIDCLPPLPLYGFSTQFRERHGFSSDQVKAQIDAWKDKQNIDMDVQRFAELPDTEGIRKTKRKFGWE